MSLEMQEALRNAADFRASMDRLNAGLAFLRERFKRVPVNDHTPVPIKRAHCHPVLGGVLYKDAKMDVPGPNFSVSSLRRAAKCGELETMWTGGNQLVTGAALRAWIDKCTQRQPSSKPPRPLNPEVRASRDREAAVASQEMVKAKLAALKLARKKRSK